MRSLKYKLVLFMLPLCLLPLIGISLFSYQVAQQQITEDRIILYLQQIAEDIASTIQLTVLEKKEETVSMTLFSEFRDLLTGETADPVPSQELLDKLVLVHEVYDLLILFDSDGRFVLSNRIDRRSRPDLPEYLNGTELARLEGQSLVPLTGGGSNWLRQVRGRRFGYVDWHLSAAVQRLYLNEGEDIARQYVIGFAAPVLDRRNVVAGGVLALMNWSYIQEILDKVEEDFEARSLGSGYAFLFGDDQNTIIGHKYRRNRDYPSIDLRELNAASNNYAARLVEDLGLDQLHDAVVTGAPFLQYEYPPGSPKISGLAPIAHEYFEWVCGVGINNEDIFRPVLRLRAILIWVASISTLVVGLLTYSVARRITIPLKRLTLGARVISGGDFSQRVDVPGRDEIAELAQTFNEMAGSLEERSSALIDLNQNLEDIVLERTAELEQTNKEVQKAYDKLKEAQFQLVQSEKMASLGQLVAGIAHEIKNPLNFIYGNTEFLKNYVNSLKSVIELYEKNGQLDPEATEALARFKEESNYDFLMDDLETLIANFEEGAKRIHDIIGDLRTFSRMESDDFARVNLHTTIDLALNLLKNEYRGRIGIVREYGDLPEVECHSGKMSQVFMNLLSNACQAIRGEGQITIRTRLLDGFVEIEIQDDGVGIPEAEQKRIFEPFFSTKPVGQGTGLGLSISYAIIQQHQGRIEVSSEPGAGTLFRIGLPVTHQS